MDFNYTKNLQTPSQKLFNSPYYTYITFLENIAAHNLAKWPTSSFSYGPGFSESQISFPPNILLFFFLRSSHLICCFVYLLGKFKEKKKKNHKIRLYHMWTKFRWNHFSSLYHQWILHSNQCLLISSQLNYGFKCSQWVVFLSCVSIFA